MTSSTSKSTQSAQSVQPCLWTAYLELKREAEALRKENAVLRQREIGRSIVETAALNKRLYAYRQRFHIRTARLPFGSKQLLSRKDIE